MSTDVPDGLKSKDDQIAPFDWYRRNRQNCEVRYDQSRDVYDLFSYEAVKEAFHMPKQLVRPDPSITDKNTNVDSTDPFKYIGQSILWTDGNSHHKMKQEMFSHFTPSALSGFRSKIDEVVEEELSEEINGKRSFDFVAEFAIPVTLKIPMELLGLPKQDYMTVFEWIEAFMETSLSEYSSKDSEESTKLIEATEYLDDIIQDRTQNPKDDLISIFVHQTSMDPEQIGANCWEILLAGQGTMTDFISNALYLDQTKSIFSRPNNMSNILEEVLRYRSPVQCQARTTTEQTHICGTTIPADSRVVLWIGSANRDAEKFENPDQFDPSRNTDHLAFGHGSHSCIGFKLARIQAPIIFTSLFNHFKTIKLHEERVLPIPSPAILSFERLPVTVTYN